MSQSKGPRCPAYKTTGATHNEARTQPQGEAASYFDHTQSFQDTLSEVRLDPSTRNAFSGRTSDGQAPYGYSQNAGKAGETYAGTAPPTSYQQTLPGSASVPAALVGVQFAPPPPQSENSESVEHNHTAGPASGPNPEGSEKPVQPAAPYDGPRIKPGKRGTVRGFVALARNEPHVRDDTPARLELLRRADKFFNEGFIGKHGRLNKEKKALFRQEMERVEANLARKESFLGTTH